MSGGNKVILVWDLSTNKNIFSLTGHAGDVNCLQFDEQRVVSGSWDKSLKLWDPRTGNHCEIFIF